MKKILPAILILFIGIYLAFAILKTEKVNVSSEHHEDAKAETVAEIPKGSHRGKLFTKDSFSLEITIFETDVPPEFRVFILDKGKPVNLDEVKLTVELRRLQRTDVIKFKKKDDYLLGTQVIEEPHSFDVKIMANYKGKNHVWEYPSYEGRTELSTESIKKSGIVIEKVRPVFMSTKLELPGEIALNTDRISHIVPQLSGIVTKVTKNMGDKVIKGELLAVINSRELAEAKREYIESVHHMELVKSTYDREENLWKKKINSEEDYFKSRHAYEESQINNNVSRQKLSVLGLSKSEISNVLTNPEQNLARFEIKAPSSGVIIEKHISMGESIKDTSDIFVVADLSTVWANITVSPKDLNTISVGQMIKIKSEAVNISTTGKIIFIGSMVGEKTRSAKAYALLNNTSGIWKPGLFIQAEVSQNATNVLMAVKAKSIQSFRDWDVIFINSGNAFQAQPVELGKRTGEWVEVISGIPPEINYVSQNSYILKADVEKSGASHDH